MHQPLGDHNPETMCVRTDSISNLITYPFSHLNPMQSLVVDVLPQDCNVVITAPTAAGKTVAIELFTAWALKHGGVAMSLFPLKALTDEKLTDWQDPRHDFSKCSIIPITSDYALTAARSLDLNSSDIIVATSEMLDSKTRNFKNNAWLDRLSVLAIDETHLIGSESRGPRLESALMRFLHHKPDCRVVLLSATVPNKDHLVQWLNNISAKKTVLIESQYRPCKLNKHLVMFQDGVVSARSQYEAIENIRMEAVLLQMQKNIQDQHLIFTGHKLWGYNFKNYLEKQGYEADFHSADLPKSRRLYIENRFKSGDLRYVISTTTLAWGVNLPARRVILAHTAYGMNPMEICDIEQIVGRSGRPGYDTQGDAYIMIPSSMYDVESKRISGGFTVKSNICSVPNLIFNAVSEIMNGHIKTRNDFSDWYKRTLAYVQGIDLPKEIIDKVFDVLEQKRMIVQEDDGKGNIIYKVSHLGQVASLMYHNPLDVYDWYMNFDKIECINPSIQDKDYIAKRINANICMALASCFEYKVNRPFISRAESDTDNVKEFAKIVGGKPNAVIKVAACYYSMMTGKGIDSALIGTSEQLKADLKRTLATMKLMHERYGKSASKKGFQYDASEWNMLYYRIMYGVPAEYCGLVCVEGIGKQYAKRLFHSGISSPKDIKNNPDVCTKLLGEKTYLKILKSIRESES